MHAYALRHTPAVVVFRTGMWLQRAARRMDAWLAARAKGREDAQALEAMTERELRDIGIDPARIHPAPWVKDWTV
jgi:uncharacterized protein YjiS (DUF1127 family)